MNSPLHTHNRYRGILDNVPVSVAIERKEKSLTDDKKSAEFDGNVKPQDNALEDSDLFNDVFPDETAMMEVVSRNVRKEQEAGALKALLRKADVKVALAECTLASLNTTYSLVSGKATLDELLTLEESMKGNMSKAANEIGKLDLFSEMIKDFPEAEAKAEELMERIRKVKNDYAAIKNNFDKAIQDQEKFKGILAGSLLILLIVFSLQMYLYLCPPQSSNSKGQVLQALVEKADHLADSVNGAMARVNTALTGKKISKIWWEIFLQSFYKTALIDL